LNIDAYIDALQFMNHKNVYQLFKLKYHL